jgi:hypothetical protein
MKRRKEENKLRQRKSRILPRIPYNILLTRADVCLIPMPNGMRLIDQSISVSIAYMSGQNRSTLVSVYWAKKQVKKVDHHYLL